MVALHVWSLTHGIASLFARGDAARRALPMPPEELLEAAMLIYLRGLGLPADVAGRAPERPIPLAKRQLPMLKRCLTAARPALAM